MRFPRPFPTFRARQLLAVAVVLAQVVAAAGAPIFVPRTSKQAAVPYPCQDHVCGCSGSEQSWAGDCCCYTLEQKLAWAEAHGIEPPAHVRPMVAARAAQKAKSSCCSKAAKSDKSSCCSHEPEAKPEHQSEAPKLKWVAGIFAQKCRGEGPAGLLEVETSVAPELPALPREPHHTSDFSRPADHHVRSTSVCPPTPPPRVS